MTKHNESINFVTPEDIEEFKSTKIPNLFEQRLVNTLEREWGRSSASDDITEDEVDLVEFEVGTGHGAWDMVDPREIIAACRRTWGKL